MEEKYLGVTVHYQGDNSSYTVFCRRDENWFPEWFDVAFDELTRIRSICIPEDGRKVVPLVNALAVQVYGIEVASKFRSQYSEFDKYVDRVQRFWAINNMVEDTDLPLRQEEAFSTVLITETGRLRHYFVFYM